MGEVIEHLIECGHKKDDIVNEYTIDQLWLFYSKSVIIRRKQQHEDAILFANCIMLGNPYAGKEAGQNFQKFLRSLLPDSFKKGLHDHDVHRMKEVSSKAPPEILNTFQQMGANLSVPLEDKAKKRKRREKRKQREQEKELLRKQAVSKQPKPPKEDRE